MGGSRSVGLLYSSEMAKPVGLVEVDVVVPSSTVPMRLSIRLRRNGTFVTLSNGATEAFLMGDTARVRLAAQFDASSYVTGAYDFDVIIGSYWSSGTFYLADTLTARVLIQNESVTPYGSGWTVGGVARVHSQTNGVLLTTGAGTVHFYALVSCSGTPPNDSCSYTSPTGSFSTLSKAPAAGTYNIVWTLSHRDGSAHRFTSDGLLKLVTDRFGNSSRIDYEFPGAGPRVWKMIATVRNPGSATDRTATFAYSGTTGKLSSITLHDGRQSAFTVTSGDLVSITDPDGVTAMTGTYVSNRLVRVSGRNGAADTVIFDAYGQIAEHKTPTVLTETHGSVRISTLIASLRAKLLTGQGTTQRGSAAAAVHRDSAFIRRTEPQGTTVTVWSHLSGAAERTEIRRPDGVTDTWRTSFNLDHQPIAQDSPDRGSMLFWTDAELRREVSFTALWRAISTTASYTKFGQVDSVTVLGSASYRNHFSGDSLLPDSSWHVSSGVAKFRYDSSGRVVSARSETVPNVVDSVTYESSYGNPVVRRRVVGTATYSKDSTTYDGSGRPATYKDVVGNTTTVYYDLLNRDTLTIAPLGARTKLKYEDPQGRATLTDPMNQVYLDSANALGWVVRQRDPRGNSETFGYDRQGNVVKRTDRNGQIITIQYDSLSRPTRRIAGTDTTHFGYGPVNIWRSARNHNSTDTLWQPSFLGNVRKSFTDRGGNRFTVEAIQSPLNQPTTVEVKSLNGGGWTRTATSSYNTQQHVSAIADFAGKTSTLSYSSYVWLSTLNNPGHTQLFSRDSAGRLQDITFNYPWTLMTPFGRHLEYDVADRATFEHHANFNRVLTYDALGRLASFTDTDTATIRSHTYVYDSVANRRDNGAVLATGNRLTRIDQYNIFYDSAGQILMKAFRYTDTVRYTWNVLGQLTRVIRWTSAGTDTTSYLYDGWGRRIGKTVDGVVTHYLHNDAQVVMELNSSFSPVTEYTYLPGVDDPHSVRTGGRMYYFARDGLGSVIGLIDTIGMAATTRYDYTPVGEILVDSGTVVQPFRFKGREWDAEARLYYMRARYYDPQLGRFISEDPTGLAGGINPYVFAAADPVNASDPSGLACKYVARLISTTFCSRDTRGPKDGGYRPRLDCASEYYYQSGSSCLDEMGARRRAIPGDDGSEPGPTQERFRAHACSARTGEITFGAGASAGFLVFNAALAFEASYNTAGQVSVSFNMNGGWGPALFVGAGLSRGLGFGRPYEAASATENSV